MTIAFVDLSFHINNTKSSQFFVDILKPLGDVHLIPNEDAWRIIPKLKPDVLILWQFLMSPDQIDSYHVKNVIIIPMYDACPHELEFWTPFKKYKFFCFSKTFYNFLTENNFNCIYSQYYMKPSASQAAKSAVNIQNAFFWQRYEKLTWNTIKNVAEKLPIKHLHFHTGLASSEDTRPTDEEIKKYSINFTSWFENKSDMDIILDTSGIYIAPRLSEGIGLSFIEAIARGNFICAYDAPTMNEYVTDGVDGILFTEDKIPSKKITKAQIALMQKKSFARAKKGYKAWNDSLEGIRNFVAQPIENYVPKTNFRGLCIRIVYTAKYIVKKIIGRA